MKIFNSKRKIPIFHNQTSKTEIDLKAGHNKALDLGILKSITLYTYIEKQGENFFHSFNFLTITSRARKPRKFKVLLI